MRHAALFGLAATALFLVAAGLQGFSDDVGRCSTAYRRQFSIRSGLSARPLLIVLSKCYDRSAVNVSERAGENPREGLVSRLNAGLPYHFEPRRFDVRQEKFL